MKLNLLFNYINIKYNYDLKLFIISNKDNNLKINIIIKFNMICYKNLKIYYNIFIPR